MTARSTRPVSGFQLTAIVMRTIAMPLVKSTHRSAYRANLSASITRATTSPGGVRGNRCCIVCPRSTASRTRSSTADHHRM